MVLRLVRFGRWAQRFRFGANFCCREASHRVVDMFVVLGLRLARHEVGFGSHYGAEMAYAL